MKSSEASLRVPIRRRSLPWLFLLGTWLATAAVRPSAAQTCDYTVTSLADNGTGTLRAGLADSTVSNICFDPSLAGGTITLASTLQVNSSVTITDPGGVTISGNNQVQIFSVNLNPTYALTASKRARTRPALVSSATGTAYLRINGMTLTQGNAPEGGAMQIYSGLVFLVGTVLSNNTASDGGAIYNQDTLTLSGCNFTGNTATSSSGGAVDNQYSLTIQGSSFSENTSAAGGGGALSNSGNASITAPSTFSSNSAAHGGAIDNVYYGTLATSAASSFSFNTATGSGGAIDNEGTAQISRALFYNNTASTNSDVVAYGGGLCNYGTATVSESTFYENTSLQSGGGIGNYGSVTLVNDTIVDNSAASSGSGLDNQSDANPTISNTIIAGNTYTSAGAANSDCNGCASINGSNNLIAVNAYLGPLAMNGGNTSTLMPLPGGPAVGGGNPSVVTDTTDQRGFARLASNGSVDIGAVQSHYNSVTFSTQPSNAIINAAISPTVAVQVLEVDGATQNYPLGVPVTLSLLTSQGVQASSNLVGTATASQTVTSGQTAASFPGLSVNAAGSYEMQASIVATPSSASQDPAYGAMSNGFQISQVPVVGLAWQPAPLIYGPMPAGELNATATINGQPSTGTFVYTFVSTGATINVGQVYPAGIYRVQVAYTPTGATGSPYTLQTSMQISPATPTIAWPTPAPIYTSSPLAAGVQLNATASGVAGAPLPGTYVYTPAAGATLSAGQQALSVTFNPTDVTDYLPATAQVMILVNPVVASVTVQDGLNPISYGQSETFTAKVKGTDGNAFTGGTATFSVDGSAIGSAPVVNGAASVASTALTAGTHQIGLSYANTATSQTLTATTSLVVNKATPVLTWATPAAIYTSTPLSSTQLDAAAAGVNGAPLAGTYSYTPASNTTLTAGTHTLSVTFTPTDTTNYGTASAQVSIQVNAPTASTIAVGLSANPITYGQSVTITGVVTGSDGNPLSGGSVAFSIDGAVAGSGSLVNGSATFTAATLTAGTHTIVASYTDATTGKSLTGPATLTVNKATPTITWPTPAPIFTSTVLSATQLNATAAGVGGGALAGSFVYTPAAGTTLTAGSHLLSTTFSPTDTVNYTTATAQVTLLVNTPGASGITLQFSANPVTFGQSVTISALVTGTDGKPYSGGTASFSADGNSIGSAAVANGVASITNATLTAGTHQISASYATQSLTTPLTGATTLTVNKAAPVLTWPVPAAITTTTALSAVQLDATAKGVSGAALPGSFAYSPAAGTMLPQGTQTLSVTFTPTDATNYTTATAQVSLQVGYSPLSITSISPSTISLSTSPVAITITGAGFTTSSVVEVSGAPVPTTFQSATALTATIPAAKLATTGTLSLSVYDSISKFTSNVIQLTVSAPAADLSLTIPQANASGQQSTISLTMSKPYASDLTGVLSLSFEPNSNGVDDPAIQFSTGGRTLNFTIPAGSTTTPQVALQTGTVAGTITVTLSLTAGGADVTPAGVSPITLVIPPAAPVITNVTFTNNSSGLITVVVTGYSNTREATQSEFVFTGTGANSLRSSKVDIPVGTLFSPWYSSSNSDQYGSEFTYTQQFQLSSPDASITGVSMTLENSIGTSESVNSQ